MARPVAKWTMNELLDACPRAADVLAEHSVDPRTRCNHAVRNYLRLGQVLGRNCPVDDVKATLADLEAHIANQPPSDQAPRLDGGTGPEEDA